MVTMDGARREDDRDRWDLCQHPNVCGENGPSWVPCCPDNQSCPTWPPGGMGPPVCPVYFDCLHCPTDQMWHLHVDQ